MAEPGKPGSDPRMGRRQFLLRAGGAGVLGAGLSFAGDLGLTAPAAAGQPPTVPAGPAGQTVFGWLPPPPAAPGSLLIVEASGFSASTLVSLAVLQGLANTRAPEGGTFAYLRIPPTPNCYPEGEYNLWPGLYAGYAGVSAATGSGSDIAALARQRGVGQYVIWDPALPATINVATTAAWLYGTAAFSPGDASGPLAEGMTLRLDMRTLGLKTAADAYRWALDQIAGLPPGPLALLSDGSDDAYTPGALVWTPRDYAVHTRAFAWIANMAQATFGGQFDPALEEAILSSTGGGQATMFGWSDSENAQVIWASRHGINFAAADSPGLPAENLTVHTAIRTVAIQHPRPPAAALEPDTVYATVVYTDGDNVGVLLEYHEGRWEDPARGEVPVGWSMQGMTPAWCPGVARYYFDSSTPNDELVAWLPFGYPDLASFVGHPRWASYVASAQQAMVGAGLQVSQSLPHRPTVLPERPSGLWDLLHGPQAPRGHLLGYAGPPGIYPIGEPLWIDGRPVLPTGGYVASYAQGGSSASAYAAAGITGAASANSGRPLFVVAGIGNCTSYQDAINTVRASFPGPVRFVLPSQLADLARQAWRRGLAGTTLLGLPTSVNLDPYFLPAGDQGSRPALFQHDGGTAQARFLDAGGSWTYAFNVEQAGSATLTFDATGAGRLEASGDGAHWQPVADIMPPPGHYAQVAADVSGSLPAAHLWLRFTAAPATSLAVTSLRLGYNGPRQKTSITAAPLPPGAELRLPSGPNLVTGTPPHVPPNVTADPGPTPGSYRLTFQDPPGEVAESGYGGTTWVSWTPPHPPRAGSYLFLLQNMTGNGTIYLDVWNGITDLASQELELSSTPHSLSLLVELPGSSPGSPPIELQARTAHFPLEVTLTPVIQALPRTAAGTAHVGTLLGQHNQAYGLSQIEEDYPGDGATQPTTVAGLTGRTTVLNYPGDTNLYFDVDDGIAYDGSYAATFTVEYYDQGTGSITLQYDSANPDGGPVSGSYTTGGTIQRTSTGTWKTATFTVPDARFANRQNGGADFRLSAAAPFTVHSMAVTITGTGVSPVSPWPPSP